MLRKFLAALSIAAVVIVTPTVAFAAEGDTPTPPASTAYPPPPPPVQELSLAGSTAGSTCNSGVPYIAYNVILTDPGNISTGHTAYLVLTDGSNTVRIELADLVNNQASGSVLWPGAAVKNGVATGWPGWELINGQYVYTGKNFGWTRGVTSATIEVNPSVVVPVSYPEATSSCASPHGDNVVASSATQTLSSTGVSPLLLPIGIVAALVVLLGLGVFLVMRRRTAR